MDASNWWLIQTSLTPQRVALASAFVYFVVPRILSFLKTLFSPIQKVPGPILNKITSWPFTLSVLRGASHHFADRLHKEYGPIVVLAPDMISISDHAEVKRIIQTQDWHKSEAVYGNFRQDPRRPTLIAFTDKAAYSVRKRMISSMFGIRYIRSMQPLMLECINVAVDKLDAQCGKQPVEVDMQHLIQSLAVDIIGVTTFGQSFNVVQNGSHPLPDQIKKALKLAGVLMLVPWIRNIPFLPARDPYVDKFTSDAVENRRAILKASNKRDLLQKLVEAGDDSEDSVFRRSDIQDEAVILLTAGSETTANAEIFTLIMLTKNKDKMAKLVAEVDKWYPPSDPDKVVDCEYSFTGMTYLQACIDETMRLVPGQATGSPRECQKEEKVLGYSIPKGTTVFPCTQNVHMDEKVWPHATEFLPERWLDIYAGGKVNEVPFWPFSAGSRVCIGKHFALQEMHMTLVSLFRRFEFEYVPGQDETTVFRVAQQLQAHRYMIKVKRRSF
ncbi:cytochrome P450 [Trichoderma reesei RUT C-30]|uniref:Cytochrome P450 n=1 Tax=Hypocrea jecorina (strain ATCC 56765 / BCRC 32924 / NRRL 11460 / Rut C-30) TaxID=1344414 RepID=A0A024SDL5_HYPJR|nr:cytochrome P450 [Trichoderma reesei RUT C-30]